jgi:hypothetical protein
MRVRLCRDCGEEFRLDAAVQTCYDCGGLIETRERPDSVEKDPDDQEPAWMRVGSDADDDADDAGEDDDEDPQDDEDQEDAVAEAPPDLRLLHSGGSAFESAPLLERLAAAEIQFWARARLNAFEVHVKPDDYERAKREREVALGIEGVDVESGFDAETGYVRCPACHARVEPSHLDCLECGLTLRAAGEDGEEEAGDCARCGKIHGATGAGCGCASG